MDITLSTQLKYYLRQRGMSVNKLSKKTGISQSYLNDLVSGEKDGYTGAQKAPVRCFGNRLSEKRKS